MHKRNIQLMVFNVNQSYVSRGLNGSDGSKGLTYVEPGPAQTRTGPGRARVFTGLGFNFSKTNSYAMKESIYF